MKKLYLPLFLSVALATSVAMASSSDIVSPQAYNSKLSVDFKPVVEITNNVRKVGIIPGESEAQKAEREKQSNEANVQVATNQSSSTVEATPVDYQIDLGSLRALYQQAAAAYGIDWKLIEAVHQVETGKSVTCKSSSAGARGPMQFLPSTFRHYNEGGNICDLRDSVFAAANLLSSAGASEGDIDSALFSYNHSYSYVQLVKSVMASI